MKKLQPKYVFEVLWSDINIGIAINKFQTKYANIPRTSFYFWPNEEAWEILKNDLYNKPWLSIKDRIEILNSFHYIINYWLENVTLHSMVNSNNSYVYVKFIGCLYS